MVSASRWLLRRELSPRAFDGEVRSLVERAALEDFRRRLDTTGPISVRSTRYTTFTGRMHLAFEDGDALELRLFWPQRGTVDTLDSIRYDDRVGWLVRTHVGGSPMVFYAWLATYRSTCSARAPLDGHSRGQAND